jgi:predicted site-specific integrase-resolvase
MEHTRPTLSARDTLSKAEAARLAGVTPRTIQRWISQGLLTRYTMQINRLAVSKRELKGLLTARTS